MSWFKAQQAKWQLAIGCGVLLMICTTLTCVGSVVGALLSDPPGDEVAAQVEATRTPTLSPTATAILEPSNTPDPTNTVEPTATIEPPAPATEVPPTTTATEIPATPTWPPTRTPSAENYVTDFERYMSEGFYMTSWYPSITGYGTSAGRIVIETWLYPDKEGEIFAAPICSAGAGYVFAASNAGQFDGVVVRGQGGKTIVSVNSVGDSCWP